MAKNAALKIHHSYFGFVSSFGIRISSFCHPYCYRRNSSRLAKIFQRTNDPPNTPNDAKHSECRACVPLAARIPAQARGSRYINSLSRSLAYLADSLRLRRSRAGQSVVLFFLSLFVSIRPAGAGFVVKTNAGRTLPRAQLRWCCLPLARWRCSYPVAGLQ